MMQQAVALHRQGQLQKARSLYNEILLRRPEHEDALHLSGVVACQMQDYAKALVLIGKAIEIKPADPVFYSNLGGAQMSLRQWDAALISYDKALAIKPDYADAHSNRGSALRELNQLDAAMASYDKAIAIAPGFADAHYNRGNLLRLLGKQAMALESYDKAISIKPDFAEAYSNRGNALRELRRLDEALASYDKAIALRPDKAEAHSSRGTVLRELGLMESALASYGRAVAIDPNYAEAHSNRGLTLHELKRFEEALVCHERAIAIQPDFANAHWNKSLALLITGQWQDGWKSYEWRWKNPTLGLKRRAFSQPVWTGSEPVSGRTVLVQCEQGLGDSIQFCRYATLLASRGARVILEAPQPLMGLFMGLEGVSQLVLQGAPLPDFDYHCALMSLPLAFNTELASVPSSPRYLDVDPGKAAFWRNKLGPKTTPRVGLAWSGNESFKNDPQRSTVLSALLQHLPPDFQYVSLQKEVRPVDRPTLAFNRNVLHFGDELHDFTETAALCSLMDVVISSCTSVAHLSGALGQRTWVMLAHVPDWRWLLYRDDSPWYPSVTCYRQEVAGDWAGVFARLGADLKKVRM